MQHPTPRFLGDDMFESVLRWTGQSASVEDLPVSATLDLMDSTVAVGLMSAWYGPQGALISNDEVAGFIAGAPDRFVGVASVDIRNPRAAVRELRRAVNDLGLKALRVLPWCLAQAFGSTCGSIW